ncbi:uncharacterized protein METZ01_LOCUS16304 [marine metagenome]|uniref:Uncharacterized protein n=1 Tax=marine metagenome TaxID=408172 RepID=A0A381P956_9ZZZZ
MIKLERIVKGILFFSHLNIPINMYNCFEDTIVAKDFLSG